MDLVKRKIGVLGVFPPRIFNALPLDSSDSNVDNNTEGINHRLFHAFCELFFAVLFNFVISRTQDLG